MTKIAPKSLSGAKAEQYREARGQISSTLGRVARHVCKKIGARDSEPHLPTGEGMAARVSKESTGTRPRNMSTLSQLKSLARVPQNVYADMKGNVPADGRTQGPNRPLVVLIATQLAKQPRFQKYPPEKLDEAINLTAQFWTASKFVLKNLFTQYRQEHPAPVGSSASTIVGTPSPAASTVTLVHAPEKLDTAPAMVRPHWSGTASPAASPVHPSIADHPKAQDIFNTHSFSSLKNSPQRMDTFNSFLRTTRNWDDAALTPFFQSLMAKPIGAHFFDHVASTMKSRGWERSTQNELMKQCVREGGCLKGTDSTAMARVFDGVHEFARHSDQETQSLLYRGLSSHIARLVPIHPRALGRVYDQNEGNVPEYGPANGDVHRKMKEGFSKLLGAIEPWTPQQQAAVLISLAHGVRVAKTHACSDDRDAAVQVINECIGQIRQRAGSWIDNEEVKRAADSVMAACQPESTEASWGERHG